MRGSCSPGHGPNGANTYIVKPVDFEQFIVAAQRIGTYRLMLNQRSPEAIVL